LGNALADYLTESLYWQIFELIAAACVDLDAQLVISLGNPNQDLNAVKLTGKPILVAYAPHQKLIDRSALVITHAELNTTIGALSAGVTNRGHPNYQ
jgi:zeaxanthin glucosyltransferase